MKQIPVPELIQGKKLLFVDDSIVRGTQLRETVDFLYESGAKEVHMRSACPPIMYGCKYLNFSRSQLRNGADRPARRFRIWRATRGRSTWTSTPTAARERGKCMLQSHLRGDGLRLAGLPVAGRPAGGHRHWTKTRSAPTAGTAKNNQDKFPEKEYYHGTQQFPVRQLRRRRRGHHRRIQGRGADEDPHRPHPQLRLSGRRGRLRRPASACPLPGWRSRCWSPAPTACGTKLKLAILMDKHDTVGIDCRGHVRQRHHLRAAQSPCSFWITSPAAKTCRRKLPQIVSGVAEGCVQSGAALIGGETAEHPGLMPVEDYDLAGFAVGIVDKKKILDKTTMRGRGRGHRAGFLRHPLQRLLAWCARFSASTRTPPKFTGPAMRWAARPLARPC